MENYLEGRDNFEDMGIVRKKEPIDEEWGNITYMVYDVINDTPTFVERLKQLKKYVSFCENKWSDKEEIDENISSRCETL